MDAPHLAIILIHDAQVWVVLWCLMCNIGPWGILCHNDACMMHSIEPFSNILNHYTVTSLSRGYTASNHDAQPYWCLMHSIELLILDTQHWAILMRDAQQWASLIWIAEQEPAWCLNQRKSQLDAFCTACQLDARTCLAKCMLQQYIGQGTHIWTGHARCVRQTMRMRRIYRIASACREVTFCHSSRTEEFCACKFQNLFSHKSNKKHCGVLGWS